MGKFFRNTSGKTEQSAKPNDEAAEKIGAIVADGPPAMPSASDGQNAVTADAAVLPNAVVSAVEQGEPLTIQPPKKKHLLDSIRPVSKLAAPEQRAELLKEYATLLLRQTDPQEGDGERLKDLMQSLNLSLDDVEHDAKGAAQLAEFKAAMAGMEGRRQQVANFAAEAQELAGEIRCYKNQIYDIEKRLNFCVGEQRMLENSDVIYATQQGELRDRYPRCFGKDDPFGPSAQAQNRNANHEVSNGSSRRWVQTDSGSYREV